jgi:hypothetical protein
VAARGRDAVGVHRAIARSAILRAGAARLVPVAHAVTARWGDALLTLTELVTATGDPTPATVVRIGLSVDAAVAALRRAIGAAALPALADLAAGAVSVAATLVARDAGVVALLRVGGAAPRPPVAGLAARVGRGRAYAVALPVAGVPRGAGVTIVAGGALR